MPDSSAVKVIARLSSVGIAALDSTTGEDGGRMRGSSARMIGTSSRYPTYTFIPTGLLADNEGRLMQELKALWRNNAVSIEINGRAITSVGELTGLGDVVGLLERRSQFIPAFNNWQGLSGTWAEVYDSTNHRFRVGRTAGAATDILLISYVPFAVDNGGSSVNNGNGFKPRGLKLYYSVDTADLTDLTVDVYQVTPSDDGTQIPAGVSISTSATYDAAHDSAAERGDDTGAPEYHTLELTFADADVDWLEGGEHFLIEVTVTDPGTAVFTYWGAEFLYFERQGPAIDA